MRWNPHLAHLVVEAVLAGLVWLLYWRLRLARRLLNTLQTELGLVKKRHEAATAGFHIRLLQVEKAVKLGVGAAPAARPVRGAAAAWPMPRRSGETTPLNHGERDLMMKVRQLNEK